MSATKRHLETLTEKHAYYAACDRRERTSYRMAVIDCGDRLVKNMKGRSLDEIYLIEQLVLDLHAMYDELKGVDDWQPPKM